jgi:purine-binding chemotaxis protein CheW
MSDSQEPKTLPEEILVFELDGQRYGLRSSGVREVLRAFSAVKLPQAPPIVEGVLNVRGEIIALLDIRKRFGMPDKAMSVSDHLLIAWDNTRWVALRVDRVVNLLRLQTHNVVPSERFLSHAETVSGVAITEDGLVLIHDLGSFLSADEKEILAQVLSAQAGEPRA